MRFKRYVLTLVAAAALIGVPTATAGPWKTPGPIQTPSGKWQTPGPLQVPRGIQAVRQAKQPCVTRLSVGADALFEFNKATLDARAAETLNAVGPLIVKAGKHPIVIEGHTDGIGTQAYNQTLSEQRATTVRDWLVAHGYVPPGTPIRGYGKTRPLAPNQKSDGADDPAGRQKNRRVEIIIDTCH